MSRAGRRVVDRLVQLRAIIDLAHASERTFADVLIDHAVAVMGVEHVGLGGDFMDQLVRSGLMRPTPPSELLLPPGLRRDAIVEGLAGPQDYPALVEVLRTRGYEGAGLDAILGANLLRLLRGALPS